jgi:hypothetical protein
MTANRFIKSVLLGSTLTLTVSTVAAGGGFQLDVKTPPSTDGDLKGAVLVVHTYGCYRPTDADVTATAEGVVGGKRQSIPLQLVASSKGVYAVKQQWPAKGVWVIAITGHYGGLTSSALVELGPNGRVQIDKQRLATKGNGIPLRIVQRRLTAQEIDSALQNLSNNKAI